MVRPLKNRAHLAVSFLSNVAYQFPAKKMTVIGVTGTDGKTTTSTLIYEILKAAGYKTALITTIGAYIEDKHYETGFHTTTPSAGTLLKYVKKAYRTGCTHLVLEVTSHALDQNRVWGIPFKIGVITNVTHEHLDYHKTIENYIKAKSKLLKRSEIAVLNKDDSSFDTLSKLLKGKKIIPYSLQNDSLIPKKINLIGKFNRQNALAAATVADLVGVKLETIRKVVSHFKAPEGRQELVHDGDFRVVIDFAHTPNAFAQVLPEIKFITEGRLIHVFGSAGKRDPYKRPYMGNESSKYADVIILTAEDPRGEDTYKINTHIRAGFQKDVEEYELTDRKEAIKKALEMAKKGDTVLITGKSHEKTMNIDGKHEIPWNDKEVVFELLQIASKK